jgi:dTMP kinase
VQVNWEEFWTVIGEWMETGFNRLEELRKREGQLKEERERALAEEATRHAAEEERKRREAEESLQKDMEKEQRKAELAAMDEADKEAAQKKK